MSRDNYICVAKYNKKFFVLANLNMETQFDKNYIKNIIDNNTDFKYTYKRNKEWCIGHDIQKKINSEYRVIEITI